MDILTVVNKVELYIDIAASYSSTDFPDMVQAALAAGLPVNPAADYPGDHIEWISALRLCLPPPFNRDIAVRENLNNLKVDMAIWKDDRP